MYKIRYLEKSDIDTLCGNSVENLNTFTKDELHKRAETHMSLGPAFTAVHEGRPVYAIGIHLLERDNLNIGLLWAVFTKEAARKKLSTFKSVKLLMKIFFKTYKFDEIWAEATCTFKETQRFLQHLGFRKYTEEKIENMYYYVLEV